MIDVQSLSDKRNVGIDKVGVRDVRIPLKIKDRSRGFQRVAASVDCFVDLPHNFRGTHMSRFVEVLFERKGSLFSAKSVRSILIMMKKKLKADSAHIVLRFPYFMEKASPVSGKKSVMSYDCIFFGDFCESFEFMIEVKVPVSTLCPCSKEISRFGAHNQRGIVTVLARCSGFVWIEEIVNIVEGSCSSPVYPLLKRQDEKFVTEKMYEKAMFVEDVVRDVVLKLEKVERIAGFRVECENFESIHAHNAYAMVDRLKRRA